MLLPPLGGGSGLLVGQSETPVQEMRRREQVKQKKTVREDKRQCDFFLLPVQC
jgi:hypothetical protein